ncbi:IS1182 family transposase, partial [Shewanella algicola]
EVAVSTGAYVNELNEAINQDRLAHGKQPLKPKENTDTKNIKVSTTDPESGFMHRDQKPQGFFYLDHRTVDGKHNIIVDTHITAGNVHDSQPYIKRLDTVLDKFNLSPLAVGLDAGYFTASVAHALEARQIAGVFGYRRPPKTKNPIKKKHFEFNAEDNHYTCPEGQQLLYKTTNRLGYREYHSDATLCVNCPRLNECTTSKGHKKVIARHVMQDSVDRANKLRLTPSGKRIYRRRCATVERSFADAKQHHGHRYARFRGLMKVQMQGLLAATAQNMKKMALLGAFLHFFRVILANMKLIRRVWDVDNQQYCFRCV